MRVSTFHGRLLTALLPIGMAVTAPSAFATLANTNFNAGDGNLVVDNGVRDWISFSSNPNLVEPDLSGSADNSFTGGSKDDSGSLTVATGSVPPNKGDLNRFFVQSENIGNNTYLYLAFTRTYFLGNANLNFEINKLVQDPVPTNNGATWVPRRSEGDLLFLYDFDSSRNSYSLKVRTWQVTKGKCTGGGSLPCWSAPSTSLLGSTAEMSVNAGKVDDPFNPGTQLEPLTFGEMAINLTAAGLLTTNCQGFGSAMVRTRASSAFDAELKDFVAPQLVSIARSADPTGARASGSGLGGSLSIFTVAATPVKEEDLSLPQPPGTNPTVSSGATGVKGQSVSDTKSASQAQFKYPMQKSTLNNKEYEAGTIATIGALRNTTTSTVSVDGARQSTTSELLGVSLLGGLVTADVISAVANTEATDRSASATTTGSGFVNLVVAGAKVSSTNPNARISLDQAKYGSGSYVSVYEVGPAKQSGTTSQPALKVYGQYKSDVTVTMIRVHITDDNGPTTTPLLGRYSPGYGGNSIDVVVGSATAHSEFYGMACTAQEVGAQAAVVDATVQQLGSVTVNYVAIPRLGGEQAASLETFKLGGAGSVPELVRLTTVASRATGVVIPLKTSESSSEAGVATACVLPTLAGCTIYLDVLKSAAHAVATSTGASADAADTAVVGTIGNVKINAPPNTRVDLPGLGFVVLNEQTCDGGSVPDGSGTCTGATRAGITIRGVHVYVNVPLNALGLDLGAEVIVTQAHADASYPPM